MSQNSNQRINLPKPNYFLTSVSITLVLFLLGTFALFTWYTSNLIDSFKESINVIVELKDSVSTSDANEVVQFLQKVPSIKSSTIDHINKEEALSIMKNEMGEDFLMDEMANPLNEVISFNVTAASFSKLYLDSLKSIVSKAHPSITSVYYQETFVDKISSIMDRFGWLIIGLTILFLVVAFTVMHNTIKLSLYSNRFLIKNMELVGASASFIRMPFLKRAFFIGLCSALVAFGLVLVLIFGINFYSGMEVIPFDQKKLAMLAGGLILIGVLITVLSTWWISTRYIRIRRDDLF